MTEDESIRVALKKAHEIRTKLDEFIMHLSEIHRKHYESRHPSFEDEKEGVEYEEEN